MEKTWILIFPIIAVLFSAIYPSDIYAQTPESLSQMSIEEAENATAFENINDTFAPSQTPESLSQMSIEEAENATAFDNADDTIQK
ncbi:MAG: hypothetical protein MRJ93_12335 [Nitrososphaeraceae archaeon]|nr:hypothetical protein [Nitrososphaeraceae archaeon]